MRFHTAFSFLALSTFCLPARAAILNIEATVSASIQEFIAGAPASESSDDSFEDDSANLPVIASADLLSTDLGGTVSGLGQAFSIVSDPARLDQPNPEDFALEAAAYSEDDEVSYRVIASANESRRVIYRSTASDPAQSPEIEFESDGTREIESSLFLSGAVILWSRATGGDAIEAVIDATVTRDGTERLLSLAAEVSITGGIEDSGLITEIVELQDLAAMEIDSESIAALSTIAGQGRLRIVIVPPQEHQYRYRVRADEEFSLSAELNIELVNAPAGTGVAAVLGRPFEDLAAFVERAIPGVRGEEFQSKLNGAIEDRDVIVVPAQDLNLTNGSFRLCGALGIMPLMIGSLLLSLMRANRPGRRF